MTAYDEVMTHFPNLCGECNKLPDSQQGPAIQTFGISFLVYMGEQHEKRTLK